VNFSGFLNGRELPDPLSLSALARTRLTIGEKPTEFVLLLILSHGKITFPFQPNSRSERKEEDDLFDLQCKSTTTHYDRRGDRMGGASKDKDTSAIVK
jgi:hypothetical protein